MFPQGYPAGASAIGHHFNPVEVPATGGRIHAKAVSTRRKLNLLLDGLPGLPATGVRYIDSANHGVSAGQFKPNGSAARKAGDKKAALHFLREAIEAGFKDVSQIENDEDLKSIRETREFRELIASIKAAATAEQTGSMNVVDWNKLDESQRHELLGARLMGVAGVVERDGAVVHVVARRLMDQLQSGLAGVLVIGDVVNLRAAVAAAMARIAPEPSRPRRSSPHIAPKRRIGGRCVKPPLRKRCTRPPS